MKRIFVQLGRNGDLCNILPLALHARLKDGEPPGLVVCAQFASLLDGVDYVVPMVYPGKFEELNEALSWVRQRFPNSKPLPVHNCQVYGRRFKFEPKCWSFLRDQWRACGYPHRPAWGTLPLVFNRRDVRREQDLRDAVFSSEKKRRWLVAVSGYSSPFANSEQFLTTLRAKAPADVEIVDLTKVKAERFYDLLGLFDAADALITIDTGHLHLANASKIPIIALTTEGPTMWHASSWRPNQLGRFGYGEALGSVDQIVDLLEHRAMPAVIYHGYNRSGVADEDTDRRNKVAEQTWAVERLYADRRWITCPFDVEKATRTSLELGDQRSRPYVRDIIEHTISKMQKGADICCVTNGDTCFTPGITGQITDAVRRRGAAFAHRWDFSRLKKVSPCESEVRAGNWYPGSDLFAFSKDWWEQHGKEFGDFVIGFEFWDCVFRQIMKSKGCEELHMCIYHERHDSFWEKPGVRGVHPCAVQNGKLAAQWFKRMGTDDKDPWNWKKF